MVRHSRCVKIINGENMNRFFVEPRNISGADIEIINKDDIKHISRVLRLAAGDRLEISDSSEFEYIGEITDISPESVTLKILDKQAFSAEPETIITLYQSIPKQSKMEVIIQKTVELGIKAIVPVFTARTVVAEKKDFGQKISRWNKVSAEAAKQCKRGFVPEVKGNIGFAEMIKELGEYDLVLFPYENEKEKTLKDVLQHSEPFAKGKKIAIIIGPEGGFADSEAEEIIENGGVSVSLGKTVLRTETAGPAALAMVMYELEL